MPKLSANLSTLFTEQPLLERVDAAARAGFRGVEVQFPYEVEKAELARRLKDAGVEMVLHNLPAGDWAGGDRGIACDPARVEEFRDGVEQALDYADALDCPRLNCLAGIPPSTAEPAEVRQTLIDNLTYAAEKLDGAGRTLLVEAVNTRNVPGFYLCHTVQVLDVLDAVGSENVRLQYDIYHMQVMEGDLACTMETHLPRIGHVQVADNPGRHEPGTGEINVPFLFDWLDRLGYNGWVGCEYVPAGDTAEGLGWARRWLQAA